MTLGPASTTTLLSVLVITTAPGACAVMKAVGVSRTGASVLHAAARPTSGNRAALRRVSMDIPPRKRVPKYKYLPSEGRARPGTPRWGWPDLPRAHRLSRA